jgi:hypothetical protein
LGESLLLPYTPGGKEERGGEEEKMCKNTGRSSKESEKQKRNEY